MLESVLMDRLEARRLCTTVVDPYPPLPDIRLLPRPINGFSYARGRAEMTFANGVLTVTGTSSNDLLTPKIRAGRLSFEAVTLFSPRDPFQPVLNRYDPYPGQLTLTDAQLPKVSDVTRIVISAGGGDDAVVLGTLAVPAEIYGDAGRDKIYGGDGNDSLYGDQGADELVGNRGNDLIVGGVGDDLLRGIKGPDTLLGQSGDDRLFAGNDEIAVSGGLGIDTAELIGTPDAVSGIEDYTAHSRRPATAINGLAGSITLSRAPGGLRLDVTLTVRGTRYQLDWDLIETSGRIEAVATPYLIDPELATTLQLNSTFSHSFDLPKNVERGNVIVSLRVSGNTVIRGRVRPTGSFTSQSFIKNDPEQETLVVV